MKKKAKSNFALLYQQKEDFSMNDVKKGSILNDIRIIKALMKMVKYKQEGNKISTNNKKVR